MAPHTDTPLRLIPVAPIGTRDVFYGEMRDRVDVYPPHPRGVTLRTTRRAFDIGLKDAAQVLGMHPADLERIEHGEATLSAEDWCRAWQTLAADWTRRNGHGGRMENLGGDHG